MAPGDFDVNTARGYFPALQQKQIYMDNAGKWIPGTWTDSGKEHISDMFDVFQEEAKYCRQLQIRE